MGQIPRFPPQLPENPMAIYLGLSPILPPVPLDLACDGHREAWSRYEAEREYEAWQSGEDYAPTPTTALWLYGGKITHVIEVPGQSDRLQCLGKFCQCRLEESHETVPA